jgi:hypothetical protein
MGGVMSMIVWYEAQHMVGQMSFLLFCCHM